jgi:hypothetical protein
MKEDDGCFELGADQIIHRPNSLLTIFPPFTMWPFSQPTWKNIASAKQNARNEAIRSTVASFPRGETSTDETEAYYAQYTGASAVQIVENISSG